MTMNKKIFLYALLFLVLSLLFSRIVFINPVTQIIGDGGDKYEFFGYMYLANQNISQFKYPFSFTTTFRYPVGFDFSYGHVGTIVALLGAFLAFLVPLPLAYNLTLVIILWINLFVTFVLLRKILMHASVPHEKRDVIAFVGALLDGWSPYVFAHLNGQISLSLTIGAPLLFYSLTNIYLLTRNNHQLRLKDFLFIPFSLIVLSLSSVQYLLIAGQIIGAVLSIFLISIFIRRDRVMIYAHLINIIKKYYTYFLFAFVFFLIPFIYFHGGYLKAILTKQIVLTSVEITNPQIRPTIIDIFVPNTYLGSWWSALNSTYETIEKPVGFGIIGWILMLGYVFYEKNTRNKQTMILLLSTILFSLLFLKLLFVPEPARIWPFISFPAIVLLVIYLRRLSKNLILILIGLLLLERVTFLIRTTSLSLPQKAVEIVRNQPGRAVFHIPLVTTQAYHSALSYFWDKSVIDGYFLHIANTPETNSFLNEQDIKKFICAKEYLTVDDIDVEGLLNKLKSLDIFTIVLIKEGAHGDMWWHKECENVRALWELIHPKRALPDEDKIVEEKFIFGRQEHINSNLLFSEDGEVRFERITVWPHSINDLSVATPGGVLVQPDWKSIVGNERDLIYDLFPRLTFPVLAGDKLTLYSNKQSQDENTYVTIYYNYKRNSNLGDRSQQIDPSPLTLIYEDSNIEVYSLK